nr:hypothetical protein [Tanacetum cinerariifolium]
MGTVAQYQDKEEVTRKSGDVEREDAIESGDISILNSLVGHGTKPFKVYIGSGETLLCENTCAQVTMDIQGLCMVVDLYGGGPPHEGCKFVSLESEEIYGVYELYNLDRGAEEKGSSHDIEVVYKWRQYLVGCQFTIRTDQRSIKELMC